MQEIIVEMLYRENHLISDEEVLVSHVGNRLWAVTGLSSVRKFFFIIVQVDFAIFCFSLIAQLFLTTRRTHTSTNIFLPLLIVLLILFSSIKVIVKL